MISIQIITKFDFSGFIRTCPSSDDVHNARRYPQCQLADGPKTKDNKTKMYSLLTQTTMSGNNKATAEYDVDSEQ